MQLGASKDDQRFESANRGERASALALARAFNLRMPDELKDQLCACAKENARSLNAEIIYRLRASLNSYTK